MINPSILILMLLLIPVVAVVVQICGVLLRQDNESGTSLGRIASMTTLAFSLCTLFCFAFFNENTDQVLSNQLQIGKFINFEFLQDRLSIFWLFLNSAIVTHVFYFNRDLMRRKDRTLVILYLVLFTAIQGVVLSNDAKIQWMLLSLSNWLVYSCHVFLNRSSDANLRSSRGLVTLTLADLFWMLGMMGGYLISGTLDIALLNSNHLYSNLSESSNLLLMTSVISLFLSIIIRLGFFPLMVWTNDFHENSASHSLLWAIPFSLAGYLLFRWLPLLTYSSEPVTLVIGLAALSSVLLAISALFQTGYQQLQRLGTALLALSLIGVVVEPNLSAQLTGFFAGVVWLMVIFSSQVAMKNSGRDSLIQVLMVLLLMSGNLGLEPVLQILGGNNRGEGVEIPPVIFPILVMTLGMFLYGMYQQIFSQTENCVTSCSKRSFNLLWGVSLLLLLQFAPFFLSPETEFKFLFPISTTLIIAISVSMTLSIQTMGGLNSFELGSLVKLCQQDYYLNEILERGLTIPIKIGSLFVHLVDQYIIQGLLVKVPGWVKDEVSSVAQEIERERTTASSCWKLLITTVVLLLSVWIGQLSF